MDKSTRSPGKRLKPIVLLIAAIMGTATLVACNDSNDSSTPAPTPAPTSAPAPTPAPTAATARTPIQHVILIIGENRTFDHVFATYTPPSGQTVNNLLSQGIVNADGTPGPNFSKAQQFSATVNGTYTNSPSNKVAYTTATFPPQMTGGAPTNANFPATAAGIQEAALIEPALPSPSINELTSNVLSFYASLATGGTGLAKNALDTRFPPSLPNGPVSMHGNLPIYQSYASSPVHRFFQMWQQVDCNPAAITAQNPSGCQNDLFPWVETSVAAGSNGAAQPANFTNQTTGEGATAMQFLNVAQGDAPYFTQLAQTYAMSDNFHQSVMGGTGANHIELGYGAPIYYADNNGNPITPPNVTGNGSTSSLIENPNPQAGTNNYYTQDGYGSTTTGGGGSYVNCADATQPGVGAIQNYLGALPYKTPNVCQTGAYYLVNNYNPGYTGNGAPAPLNTTNSSGTAVPTFTVPPTTQNNIGLLLTKHNVSWKYYGEGWDGGQEDGEAGTFCNICDPFLYSTQIMTNPTLRANNQDIGQLYSDIQSNSLPAVSIVKPDGLLDGHPASSKLDLFEGFVKKIVDNVQANPAVWGNTAIFITFDEGGGYYDSGYIQPVDFFGDGTRIPMIVVSKYSTGGKVSHVYGDHVSFDKFVEYNWGLGETISTTSRDNLPNPTKGPNAYVPGNQPAIGDLTDLFTFPSGS